MKEVALKFKKRGFLPIGIGGSILPGTDGLLFIKKGSKTENKIKNRRIESSTPPFNFFLLGERISGLIHQRTSHEDE